LVTTPKTAASEPAGPPSPGLPLSARERTVATLFADDHSSDDIALVLGLSPETVRSYLTRVRLKYKNDGRPTANKLQLRAQLVKDGYLEE
jgi:DNA-binding CsgD family transcriptional regulator